MPNCPRCGAQLSQEGAACPTCAPEQYRAAQSSDSRVERVIPYKNTAALVAYYAGIFALIPCLGLPLALVSIPAGIIGLNNAKAHPEKHGAGHAWAGIILGIVVFAYHGLAYWWLNYAK